MKQPLLTLLLILFCMPRADAASLQLTCTAWGGSHTGRYTFDIDGQTCEVYWREIGIRLAPILCQPPHIEAIKPFAPARGYILKFNLKTGTFSDHVPGWADRGSCSRIKDSLEFRFGPVHD